MLMRRTVEDRPCNRRTEPGACPPEERLIALAEVHSRRHTQRVQQDVDRRSIIQERHVFFRDDPGDDTLVTVPAGHLVTDLDLTLLGDIDLRQLNDTRRQLVTHLYVVTLTLEVGVEPEVHLAVVPE